MAETMLPGLGTWMVLMLSVLPILTASKYVPIAQHIYHTSVVSSVRNPLEYSGLRGGRSIKNGTNLRILPVGDSITVGWLSDRDGGDGNGYLEQLRENLSGNKVVFAGLEHYPDSTMTDNYFAAWSGKTNKYIMDNLPPSLDQNPNVVLIHAGTNDMNPEPMVSTEGDNPAEAAERLGYLIDTVVHALPDALVLVAMIINSCSQVQESNTLIYQQLIPGVVDDRLNEGKRVIAADFTEIPMDELRDCVHPTNDGYKLLGDYWYDFLTQAPEEWIEEAQGPDPARDDPNGVSSRPTLSLGLIALPLLVHFGVGTFSGELPG